MIARCLDALFTGVEPGDLNVVVVCNGCDDDTADRARSSGHQIRVLEIEVASKAAALRAGDRAAALSFPRLYLDADVVLPGSSALAVINRLNAGAVAARPPVVYDSSRSSALVRSYYRARARIPAVLKSLWGAGVYGLSATGRERFEEFPMLTADDLWIDRQFMPDEVEIVDCTPVLVAVPRRATDLVHTLRRTYRGKVENRPEQGADERGREITVSTLKDLRRLAASGPAPAMDAAVYAAFAIAGRLRLMLTQRAGATAAQGWERDNSSRSDTSEAKPLAGRC